MRPSRGAVRASGDVGGRAGLGMAPAEARALYDDWGAGYAPSMEGWGYDMPRQIAARCASGARAALQAAEAGPPVWVLDAGAGDGLSGAHLRAAGFDSERARIVGLDLSPRLLELAAARGCYDEVRETDLHAPLAYAENTFDVVACVGTLSYVAPACGILGEFARVAKPGGIVCYNLRTDHVAAWRNAQQALVDARAWELLEETQPLPYLPRNPDYSEKVQTAIFTFRVLGSPRP